jgi:hypothetical protein
MEMLSEDDLNLKDMTREELDRAGISGLPLLRPRTTSILPIRTASSSSAISSRSLLGLPRRRSTQETRRQKTGRARPAAHRPCPQGGRPESEAPPSGALVLRHLKERHRLVSCAGTQSRRARLSPRGGRPVISRGERLAPRIRRARDEAGGLPRGAGDPPRGANRLPHGANGLPREIVACPAGRTTCPADFAAPSKAAVRQRTARQFLIHSHLLASWAEYLYHYESVKSHVDCFAGPDGSSLR